MIGLQLKADLEGVTDFWFDDNLVNPYYFTFKVSCTKCRETHANPIKFQQHEKEDLPNSRGDANIVMKCKFCGNHQNINVIAENKTAYTEEDDKAKTVATFDPRGVDLIEFLPEGQFTAKSSNNATKFEVEFDESGEWYDYDEAAGSEVSITGLEWTIVKLK